MHYLPIITPITFSHTTPPPWQWPSHPWSCLHLEFAGPYMGQMFLVIVGAHSKWPDATYCNQSHPVRRSKYFNPFLLHMVCHRKLSQKWNTIHESRILRVRASKWDKACDVFSLPPVNKWTCRKECSNVEAWNQADEGSF